MVVALSLYSWLDELFPACTLSSDDTSRLWTRRRSFRSLTTPLPIHVLHTCGHTGFKVINDQSKAWNSFLHHSQLKKYKTPALHIRVSHPSGGNCYLSVMGLSAACFIELEMHYDSNWLSETQLFAYSNYRFIFSVGQFHRLMLSNM